ncbi:MAG TPA: hypothetical protein GYA08_24755 [Chloroflexi bacterium]|nr:hypothetical protein [Chloroflexota bacterium]
MTADQHVLRTGALGAGLSVRMLVLMALTPLSGGEPDPGRAGALLDLSENSSIQQ